MSTAAAGVFVAVVLGARGVVAMAGRARARARAARLRGALADGVVAQPRSVRAVIAIPPRWFVDALDFAPGAPAPVRAWRWYAGAGFGLGGVLASVVNPVIGLVVIAVFGAAPPVLRAVGAARRASAYDAALAVALDGLARAVRGGGSLQSAIGEAAGDVPGDVGRDLRRVATSVARGGRLESALSQWRRDRDRPSVRLAVGAIALAAQTGGPPARVIEDVAASLRTRMQIEGEARALGSQARLSAIVVGIAPVGFALVACAADARNAQLMFGTPIGLACVVVGVVLDVTGALWMHRISETVLG